MTRDARVRMSVRLEGGEDAPKCTHCDLPLVKDVVKLEVGQVHPITGNFYETRPKERQLLCEYCAEQRIQW